MNTINDIPISVGDVVACDFNMYGITDTLICTITEIQPHSIKIKINNTDEQYWRYRDTKWFYGEWRVTSEYIVEVIEHIAPKVPEINETIIKNRNVLLY